MMFTQSCRQGEEVYGQTGSDGEAYQKGTKPKCALSLHPSSPFQAWGEQTSATAKCDGEKLAKILDLGIIFQKDILVSLQTLQSKVVLYM